MQTPQLEDLAHWHRRFATECHAAAWSLSNNLQPMAVASDDLLHAAHAAAFHWSKVGSIMNVIRSDMLLAHAHAVAGSPELALRYAERCLDLCQSNPCDDYDLAFAHAVMAEAAAARHDVTQHALHYSEADRLGTTIRNADDRAAFATYFDRIPHPLSSPWVV